jgi:gamma-glutamyltranspeptidase/glutathione hydrolase
MSPRSHVAALMTAAAVTCGALAAEADAATKTMKPPLHAKQWLAITGKPLGATAGAMIFQQGGNAVDSACAMIAATATMWDVLHWGGETQALIYNPHTGKVIGVNGLGVAPSGATPAFFRGQGLRYPPAYGPQAAVTPGTPGGLLLMFAEYGRLSLAQVLAPAIDLADGYPIERETADLIEHHKERLKQWPDSRRVMLPHAGEARESPHPGEIFRQPELAATLRKLVEAEKAALAAGADRKAAIMAAFDRFYRGDIAAEIARATRAAGGLITREDLAGWRPKFEEPVTVNYRGIDVYKLTTWTQGPALLQALNVLENFDVKAMGYNSPRYLHTLYQAMSLAFADRDFYYGDPTFLPEEPVQGLLSKDYARERAKQVGFEPNDPAIGPGDPYPFQGGRNPFMRELAGWAATASIKQDQAIRPGFQPTTGTTSVVAADREGWVVAVTPSGGWIPAFIAGSTGIGLSQRMQSFVLDPAENPYNVLEPGKQPRVTLTPTMALKDGKPFMAFAVQGGDSQDQNLLQLFLNVVEFGMTVQQATEAANMNSFQLRDSFDQHETQPGRMLVSESTPPEVRAELGKMGYTLVTRPITSGPLNAIWFDAVHGTMWGGSSHHGEDYGIGW